MTTPIEIMERLKSLPMHLQAHERRFYVEAVSDETRAPLVEWDEKGDAAAAAAQAWAKAHGADGIYAPNQSWGREPRPVAAFSFKRENAPAGQAWVAAGRGFVARHGYVALRPSKRPAGKALAKEIEALPGFPSYASAVEHLGAIQNLRTSKGGGGVGHSDGSWHFTIPVVVGDRCFISAVNHNYDIARSATQAAEYLSGEHPEWAPSLDYEGDPIAWRPGAGWAFVTRVELDLVVAEENARRARLRAAA